MRPFLILLLVAATLGAQQPPPKPEVEHTDEPVTFRTGVSQVKLDVAVADKGRNIGGLNKDDFLVYDEGAPQEVTYFGREREPLRLLLLIDVSGSVSKYRDQLAGRAREALKVLQPGDEAGVMLFSRRTDILMELTGDLVSVERGIQLAARDQNLGSGTSINTAIIEAANYMASAPPPAEGHTARNAILILTDNGGLNYQVPNEEVLRALYAGDTVLNALVVAGGSRPRPPKPGEHRNPDFTPSDVFLLADKTGGDVVETKQAGEDFERILERIRTRYVLLYKAPEAEAGSFRRVMVELAPDARRRYKNASVRVREGYVAK